MIFLRWLISWVAFFVFLNFLYERIFNDVVEDDEDGEEDSFDFGDY